MSNTTTTTEVRERPILFSSEMVQAILEGRKTQTRRIVKKFPEPGLMLEGEEAAWCPYGEAGDRLWVREAWTNRHPYLLPEDPDSPIFAADYLALKASTPKAFHAFGWKPSIHLPRKYSRLTLEITGVRVERLQDISEQGAIAEGFDTLLYGGGLNVRARGKYRHAKDWFEELWDSLNAKSGYGWHSNPWVWCISFKRVDQEEATTNANR